MNDKNIFNNEVIKIISLNELYSDDDSISMFQKVMLVTDGTISDLLRLYTRKRITVKKLMQLIKVSGTEESNLCEHETQLLKREILLGTRGENYIYADSLFNLSIMSTEMKIKLMETDIPIGIIWKEEKLDIFREIIEIKIEKCSNIINHFTVPPDTPFFSRTYMIYHNRKILGIITEKFPITYFRELGKAQKVINQ